MENGYLQRNETVVWREIAGEVVIADRDNNTVRVLNRVASVIWKLADGTRQLNDIAESVFEEFEVSREQARSDSEEFLRELIAVKLVNCANVSQRG